MKVQVLLLLEQAEEQFVESGVEIPIDKPQVITGHVIPMVSEFDALAFATTATLAFELTAKYLPRDEFESFQPAQGFG
jgi:hypothetical protein